MNGALGCSLCYNVRWRAIMHLVGCCRLLPAMYMKALRGLPDKDKEECNKDSCEDGQWS